jgi:lipase chaperone LimK
VVIRSSSAREIEQLVAQLYQAPGVECDAAIARLTIIGARAIERLAALAVSNAHASARTAALQAARGILSREKLTARHAAVRRIRARFPGFL